MKTFYSFILVLIFSILTLVLALRTPKNKEYSNKSFKDFLKKYYILSLPVILLIITLVLGTLLSNTEQNQVNLCLQDSNNIKNFNGKLRKAGHSYFVYTDKWKFIVDDCSGKGRTSCLKNNPEKGFLEENIGKEISVNFCNKYPLDFSIDGIKYEIFKNQKTLP